MDDKKKDIKEPSKKPLIYYYMIALLAVFLLNWLVFPSLLQPKVVEVSYSDFLQQIADQKVTQVEMQENQILFIGLGDDGQELFYETAYVDDPELVTRLESQNIEFGGVIPSQPSVLLNILLSYGVPILIFIGLGQLISKNMLKHGGGNGLMFGQGNSGKIYVPDSDKKTFADVAGQEEAKDSLTEIIDYLSHPDKYTEIGAECPKGILLIGPPGTGKTLLAKAVAGEAHVPFFSISGSEFVEMFVGRGAAKVRELFNQAGEKAPCIVFIDELDTIGKRRDSGFGSNDEREQTLNQLLTEMDGFEGNKGVIILAATNRPEVLDPALLRPGRFDRQIQVELPDLQGRIDILKVHAKRYKLEPDIDFNLLARATAGASGAQLANIVNEGALRAVRMSRQAVTQADLEESIEVVIAGMQKKNDIMSQEEKKIVSYHEIGHALVAAKQTQSAPVHKITIVPRTSGALGYTMQVEAGDKVLVNRTEIINKITTFCGGRAAEELIFGDYTTGASNDIEQATKLARAMVTKYGMTETFGMMALETGGNNYLDQEGQMTCSPDTARKVDEETLAIIKGAQKKAIEILKENEKKLHELSNFLIEKETITGEEFMEILNRPEAVLAC